MKEKVNAMREGNEVAINAEESKRFVELCIESGVTPHCTGCQTILGNVIVYFTA